MCKVFFFLLRPVGRRDLSAGPEQNKKHHPRVFFLAPAPAKGRGRSAPLGAGTGWCFCFCSGPERCRRPTGRSLSPGPEQNKTPWVVLCFFALAPPKGRGAQQGATNKNTLHTRGRQQKKILETNDTGHEQKGATKNQKSPWPFTATRGGVLVLVEVSVPLMYTFNAKAFMP